jgi:hypothetical protein
MSGASFRILKDGAHLIPAEIYVPEVVIDEVVNRYREDVAETIETHEKATNALRKLLPEISAKLQVSPVNPTEMGVKYQAWFLNELKLLRVKVLPYPKVSHKDVVARDLLRRSPFKRNGSGYRDCLIWESIRDLARCSTDKIVLISANKRDFGGESLSDDLTKDVPSPDRLQIQPSLRQFVESEITPKLELANELKNALVTGSGTGFSIRDWLNSNLLKILCDYDDDLGAYLLGFPDGAGRVRPTAIRSFDNFAINLILRLSPEEILVRVSVSIKLDFEVNLDWEDYENHYEIRAYLGETEPFSFIFGLTDSGELELDFVFVLDATLAKLLSCDFVSIRGEHAYSNWSEVPVEGS